MGKTILILNGSPRKNGNTSALVEAFARGAEEGGSKVVPVFLGDMTIHGCKGCFGGGKNPDSPCVQKDDMEKLYPVYRQADVVVLDMPLLDTRKSGKNLMGVFVADLVLQILSYVAQTERENIRQRQKEGIAAARQRGVKFGRPRKRIPEEFAPLKDAWMGKQLSSREAARQLGVSQDTFLRWAKEPIS